MRRAMLLSMCALTLLGIVSMGGRGAAQAQDGSGDTHPIVGTWLADTDPENTEDALDTFQFSADGGYIEVDSNGDVQLGSWEETGEYTANLTIVAYQGDDDGNNYGGYTVRGSITVAADGMSFDATYTLEVLAPDGSGSGQAGPGHATGTRLEIEAPGTPVMSIEDLFSG